LVAFAALPALVLAGVGVAQYWPHDPPPPLPLPRDPVLPDLTMPALADVVAARLEGGDTQQLFFSASIANIGPGTFAIKAVRGDERGAWRVSQLFEERNGTTSERRTPADMVWGGHGHDHWHVQIGATYRLYALPSMRLVGSYEKVGYCFFDQVRFDPTLPNAPRGQVFTKDVCNGHSTLALEMGLSPGWQDPYTWALPDQRIEITGLPDGDYRLVAKADPHNWFRETNEKNNETWVDVRLTPSVRPPRATVLRVGPHASPGRT
jgi:hypothetical protein